MNWLQILAAILGSGGVVALINLIQDRLKRKDTVTDQWDEVLQLIENLRAGNESKFNDLQNQLKEFEGKLDNCIANTDCLGEMTLTQSQDRIRYLGLQYINNKKIHPEELRNLIQMHDVYEKLGGNGFLDNIMERVMSLEIVND